MYFFWILVFPAYAGTGMTSFGIIVFLLDSSVPSLHWDWNDKYWFYCVSDVSKE
jgi:hypothetical protein